MLLLNNLSTKELYASIPRTATVSQMMRDGMEQGSTQLAVSAMEELSKRGDTDIIVKNLFEAAKNGVLVPGTSMASMISRSLIEDRETDPLLRRAGKWLLQGNPLTDTSFVSGKTEVEKVSKYLNGPEPESTAMASAFAEIHASVARAMEKAEAVKRFAQSGPRSYVHDDKQTLLFNHESEERPTGVFHDGRDVEVRPAGTFHDEEPTGAFRDGETYPAGTFHNDV